MNNFKTNFETILVLTLAQMKARYRKTFIGFLWVVLSPILTFVVQALVFKHILKVHIDNYYLFLLSGIIPWIFVTSSMTMTVPGFITNRQLFLAFNIKPWVIHCSKILDNFINFIISYIILIALIDFQALLNPWTGPLLILSIIALLVFTFSLTYFLATFNVFFRDTQFVIAFVISLAFFVTPIFYPIELIPEKFRILIEFNPFYIIIRPFQYLFWKYDLKLFYQTFLIALPLTIASAVGAYLYWRKVKNNVYFNI